MLTEKFFVIAHFGHEATLWLLVALSIFSVAFIIERWVAISQAQKNSAGVSKKLQATLQNFSLKDIETVGEKNTFEGQVLAHGIRHSKEFGPAGLEEIFNSYAQMERPILEKRLNFLATVGSNAPFIGLLGTVFGIMDAFRGLANSSGDFQTVLLGISQALVATATGLLVAIPAVIAYNYFQKRVRGVMQNLEGLRDVCVAYAKTQKRT